MVTVRTTRETISRLRHKGLFALVVTLGWCAGVLAAPFTQVKNVSLFTDIRAHKVGDLLTVLIVETSSARNAVGTTTKKSASFDAEGGPGIGPLDFVGVFGLNGATDQSSGSNGSTSRTGQLKAQMTVQVAGVRDNGDLVIQGTRVVGINNDKEMITLTGIVRSEDVTTSNTVYSHQIADAQISYRGKGTAANGGKPGVVTRVLNWLF